MKPKQLPSVVACICLMAGPTALAEDTERKSAPSWERLGTAIWGDLDFSDVPLALEHALRDVPPALEDAAYDLLLTDPDLSGRWTCGADYLDAAGEWKRVTSDSEDVLLIEHAAPALRFTAEQAGATPASRASNVETKARALSIECTADLRGRKIFLCDCAGLVEGEVTDEPGCGELGTLSGNGESWTRVISGLNGRVTCRKQ